ncbi:Hsp33 family molecular chaperone HslO [Thalassotalea sp. M1531]|uniref:33 kDa chaperonin n=1 Tax=Thalassotalea algicola TaxID=2716224 RepID=A0A7Y0L9I8_9GAMM|nr:Hsp33 family molecular chaperone HslO [Thalassotalea algicola]NMP30435.1 Hsp33 family molecular chaperone HslO [Thalassotalea algicola]
MSTQDMLNRYLFDDKHARGELVQIHQAYQDIVKNHNYPDGVKALLGELLAATCLLTATLKFEGEIAVQLQGASDAPINYMAINGDHQQNMRGVAKLQQESDATTLHDLIGKGIMVITIRPFKGEPYQGVVPLEKPTLAECLANYFETSDQIPTTIWLFTDIAANKVAGSLIQLLPDSEDKEQQMADYDHLCALTKTISAKEIFELPAEELLHRLYHEEQVRLFEPQAVTYQCSCSEEKCLGAIAQIGASELKSIFEEQGNVSMTCDYCLTTYAFNEQQLSAYLTETKH